MASNWNRLMDGLTQTPLSQYETRIVAAIARKTLGWQKESDTISEYQLATMTGLHRRHVGRTLAQLEQRNIITTNGRSRGRAARLAINLNVSEWLPNPTQLAPVEVLVTSTRGGASRSKQLAPVEVLQLAPVEVHTRGKGLKKAATSVAGGETAALLTRAFDTYREAAGQVPNPKERSALARNVSSLAKSGIDDQIILAAVRQIGREREFTGSLKARVSEIVESGGLCIHDGRDRRTLPLEALERCGCARCQEWTQALAGAAA